MTRLFPTAFLALFVGYALGIVGALSDLPRSPPHEAQLFFADHLARGWWNQLDPRWYGGVDVTQVPLVHAQLTALLSKVPGLGLERAYAVLLALSGVVAALGVVRFARSLAVNGVVDWLVVAAVASPAVWCALIPGGGLPVVLALGFALNAAAELTPRAVTPTLLTDVSSLALAGAAVATDVTGALTLALCAPLLAVTHARRALACLAGAGLGAMASATAYGSGASVLSAMELPHARWLALVLAAACATWLVWKRQRRAAVVAVCAAALAGLADFVPVRLELVAVVVTTVSLALAAAAPAARSRLALGVAVLSFAVTAAALGWARNQDTRSRRAALREVEWVLANVEDGARFRFLTLGVGPEWLELSRRVRPRSMDGGLVGSTPSWDELDLSDAAHAQRLQQVLSRDDAAIRWVIVGRASAQGVLEPLGFVSVGAWRGNVTLWERASTKPLEVDTQRARLPWRVAVLSALLGLAGLLVLGLGLISLIRTTTSSVAAAPGSSPHASVS